MGSQPKQKEPPKPEPPKRVDEATKSYQKYKDDINGWFTKNDPLKFDADYRSWLRDLIKGAATQGGAINWQDIGIPAYIAEERLADLGVYFITDQSTPLNEEKAIVLMDRSTLSRDALLAALMNSNTAKCWDFEGAAIISKDLSHGLKVKKTR